MPVCGCCEARANLAGDSGNPGAVAVVRASCGRRHGGAPRACSRGGSGGTGRTGAKRPSTLELQELRASFEDQVEQALSAWNSSMQAQYRLDVATKRRRLSLRGENPVCAQVPFPAPNTLWSMQNAPANSVWCACCRDRGNVVCGHLDPVRCFSEFNQPSQEHVTPLRTKLILLAETALVRARKAQYEAAVTDCNAKAQSLEVRTAEFVCAMHTSTQSFAAAARENRIWPTRLPMKAHLKRRSADGNKTMTLR